MTHISSHKYHISPAVSKHLAGSFTYSLNSIYEGNASLNETITSQQATIYLKSISIVCGMFCQQIVSGYYKFPAHIPLTRYLLNNIKTVS
jgi:hypothetical protein